MVPLWKRTIFSTPKTNNSCQNKNKSQSWRNLRTSSKQTPWRLFGKAFFISCLIHLKNTKPTNFGTKDSLNFVKCNFLNPPNVGQKYYKSWFELSCYVLYYKVHHSGHLFPVCGRFYYRVWMRTFYVWIVYNNIDIRAPKPSCATNARKSDVRSAYDGRKPDVLSMCDRQISGFFHGLTGQLKKLGFVSQSPSYMYFGQPQTTRRK